MAGNFQKIASGVNVTPLLRALEQQPSLWNQFTLRTAFPGSPQAAVDDIWLRFANIQLSSATMTTEQWMKADKEQTQDIVKIVLDDFDTIDWPAFDLLPQAKPIVFDLMWLVQGERLGRVLITRLAPGQRIVPHSDGGKYARHYDRYHVTLQNQPQSLFRAGDETVYMKPGEIWWFDTNAEHEVVNDSRENRITMIVDIRRHGRVE